MNNQNLFHHFIKARKFFTNLIMVVLSSGGSDQPEERIQEVNSNLEKKVAAHAEPPEERDSRIQAARARFLARKAQK